MMKRFLFYAALLLQISMMILIVIQYNLIDDYGQSIQLRTVKQDYYGSYDPSIEQTVYTQYDINFITNDQLEMSGSLDYNEKVYVVLELTEDGFYEVEKVRKDNFIKTTDQQIVVVGKYQYEDTWLRQHVVHYGFEYLDRREIGYDYRPDRLAAVTVKVAPWGQKKVVDIELIED